MTVRSFMFRNSFFLDVPHHILRPVSLLIIQVHSMLSTNMAPSALASAVDDAARSPFGRDSPTAAAGVSPSAARGVLGVYHVRVCIICACKCECECDCMTRAHVARSCVCLRLLMLFLKYFSIS